MPLRPDAALVMNVANGYFLPFLNARRIPTLVNVDGIEWERGKWSPLAQRVFRIGAGLTARHADGLVFDSRAIETYWRQAFGVGERTSPWRRRARPASHPGRVDTPRICAVRREIRRREQRAGVLRSRAVYCRQIPGGDRREFWLWGEWDDAAKTLAEGHPDVSWLGHVSNDSLLLALWQHAGLYFHGHSVGGTNPALVQAMAAGAPILARDTVYNREVLGATANLVTPDSGRSPDRYSH